VVVEIEPLCLSAAAIPSEDEPPLIIDADRVKARQGAAKPLEVIARRHPKIPIASRIVDHLELTKQPAFKIGRNVPRLPILDEKGPQPVEDRLGFLALRTAGTAYIHRVAAALKS
jgi:hypothetical protein